MLVSGTGDGGILDVLRAKLKEFDHGGFQRVRTPARTRWTCRAQKAIEEQKSVLLTRFNKKKLAAGEIERWMSGWLHEQYCRFMGLEAIDEILGVVRLQTHVVWIGMTEFPISPNSQALNRVFAWRLWQQGYVEYRQGKLSSIRHLESRERERVSL